MKTDWNNLIREIENGHCAIFLGHGLLTDAADGQPLYSKYCDQLAEENRDLLHSYYPDENFFLFKARQDRRKFANRIGDFYSSLQPDVAVYQKLAEIPVSLYISATPDHFLEKSLGDDAEVLVFNEHAGRGQTVEASKSRPLVYKIFGSSNDGSSLLLSHDDLFDFFKTVLSEHTLPTTVKKFFKENAGGEVIFLGFTFRKWYLQLLLRLFNLSKTDNELNRTAYVSADPQDDEISFATHHFQIKYVETRIREFVDELHERCKAKGILRQLNTARQDAGAALVEDRKTRVEGLKKQLLALSKLRNDWEEKQLYADDPRKIMECDAELARLKEQIDKSREELKALSL